MIDVSVIIPCYNAEKTIIETLNSIREQTFSNYEIIIVDDGSMDDTYEIIQQYKVENPNLIITLLKQENTGVSAARNAALGIATGKYIAFIDADDVYHDHFLEYLVVQMKKDNCDIVMCRYQNDYFKTPKCLNLKKSKITKEKLLEMYFHKRVNKLNFWGAIYRKELLDRYNIRFSEGIKYGEDTEFFGKYLYHCDNVIFIDEDLYGYIIRENSAMKKNDYAKTENIKMFQNVLSYWGEDSPKKSEYIIARAIWSCLKDFAISDKKFYIKFREEYDIRKAMKVLVKNEDEILVATSAHIYLLNQSLFVFFIKVYTIFNNAFCRPKPKSC